MKRALSIAGLVTGSLLCACAEPPAPASEARVSVAYEATCDPCDVRAFVYGKRTVLEFVRRPRWLLIRDENGATVSYEREGRYYRLARTLDRFKVRTDDGVLLFDPNDGEAPAATTGAAVRADPTPIPAHMEDAAPATAPSTMTEAARTLNRHVDIEPVDHSQPEPKPETVRLERALP